MDFAAGDPFITSETVATERPRCSASSRKLTRRSELAGLPALFSDLRRDISGMVGVVCHRSNPAASQGAPCGVVAMASFGRRNPKINRFTWAFCCYKLAGLPLLFAPDNAC